MHRSKWLPVPATRPTKLPPPGATRTPTTGTSPTRAVSTRARGVKGPVAIIPMPPPGSAKKPIGQADRE